MSEGGQQPKLVSRREHKKSTFRQGRTIGAKREHLETANERAAARKKDKYKKTLRVTTSIILFAIFIIVLAVLIVTFVSRGESSPVAQYIPAYEPTIEIIDESSSSNSDKITSRMKEYIGQAETSFKEKGYTLVKAIIPQGSIREVDFYLEGQKGYFKAITDREAGVTVEDADRMLRYLASQGITEFEYIDLRTDGRAFWR